MLGIAHVGFVSMLEEAGVRFLGVGGTSAGAIHAALIAGLRHEPQKPSWPKTLEVRSKQMHQRNQPHMRDNFLRRCVPLNSYTYVPVP